ncbi:hypothetical protein H7849_09480 [Alloacidobacterium dinghuense]|uniref:Uncharacterized protein n=1 Tax=Alloacidobacterium dinghuense TaxID=2763107 RepID=A0A7G8BNI7_9BACT|nr:hypothetical protein [Alloacidobacterium dinghuense]QNI34107.1 hypothetical protein H7849_09480 [Alloacidobacterium dinghuense]
MASAVTCTTQSQMTETQRTTYIQAVQSLASEIQSGNVSAVKANTIASVAAQFDSIAGTIQSVAPLIQGSVLTIESIYSLQATDLKSPLDTQFFCSVPGSQLLINISIPQLPPGDYAFTVVHATGGKQPQQMAMILQNDPTGSAQWKLAGVFVRPLTSGGHDGVWYWTQARAYASKKQQWNAFFYYQNAAYLLSPVDFISSPNLEKLQKEMSAVRPDGLPDQEPMKIESNGQIFEITNVHTDGSLGGLDLVVNYKASDVSDPVATRSRNVAVMKALLTQHPELREAFHGLWVYANAENQRPFAIELPMNQIQ